MAVTGPDRKEKAAVIELARQPFFGNLFRHGHRHLGLDSTISCLKREIG